MQIVEQEPQERPAERSSKGELGQGVWEVFHAPHFKLLETGARRRLRAGRTTFLLGRTRSRLSADESRSTRARARALPEEAGGGAEMISGRKLVNWWDNAAAESVWCKEGWISPVVAPRALRAQQPRCVDGGKARPGRDEVQGGPR